MAVMIITDKSSSWDRVIHEGVTYAETHPGDFDTIRNDLKMYPLAYYAGYFYGLVCEDTLIDVLPPDVLERFTKEWFYRFH